MIGNYFGVTYYILPSLSYTLPKSQNYIHIHNLFQNYTQNSNYNLQTRQMYNKHNPESSQIKSKIISILNFGCTSNHLKTKKKTKKFKKFGFQNPTLQRLKFGCIICALSFTLLLHHFIKYKPVETKLTSKIF